MAAQRRLWEFPQGVSAGTHNDRHMQVGEILETLALPEAPEKPESLAATQEVGS